MDTWPGKVFIYLGVEIAVWLESQTQSGGCLTSCYGFPWFNTRKVQYGIVAPVGCKSTPLALKRRAMRMAREHVDMLVDTSPSG